MSILETCQKAARLLSMGVPSTVFSGTDSFGAELGELANEAALAMLQDYDWRRVTKLATVTANSVDTVFSLPADYARMPKTGSIYPAGSVGTPLQRYDDLDDWLYADQSGITTVYGRWIVLSGSLNIKPAPTQNLTYYYISNQIGTRASAAITSFAQDNDSFVLDERLLKLELIWRYKAAKGFEYAEDMKNAEKAKDQAHGREKGTTLIAVGRARMNSMGAEMAFPGVISP